MPNVRLSKRSISGLILATYAVLQTIMLICSSGIQAAEYRFQPSIALMAETDDNVSLKEKDLETYSLKGGSAIFNADFSRNQANSSLSMNGRFTHRQYDLNHYNSEDVSATVSYQQIFERGSLSLNFSAGNESMRSFENQLENDGSTEQRAIKATSFSFGISGQRQLTERQFLQNQFSVQQRNYDSGNRSNYDYFSNSLLWVYSIRPSLSAKVNLSLASYRPEKTDGIEFAFTDVARDKYDISGLALLGIMEYCADFLDPSDPYNPETIPLGQPAPVPNFDASEAKCFNNKSFSFIQDTVNLQLGLQYQWTENLRLDLLFGSSYSYRERDIFDELATGLHVYYPKYETLQEFTEWLYKHPDNPDNYLQYLYDRSQFNGELSYNFREETEEDNLSYSLDLNYQHTARTLISIKTSQSQAQTTNGESANTRRIIFSSRWSLTNLDSIKVELSKKSRYGSLSVPAYKKSDLSFSYTRIWNQQLRSNLRYIFTENRKSGHSSYGHRNLWMMTLTLQPKATDWSK